MGNSTVQYEKDDGYYSKPCNYSGTFGKVDKIALDLINSCKAVYKDVFGEYVYDAKEFDEKGNVFFSRRYLHCFDCGELIRDGFCACNKMSKEEIGKASLKDKTEYFKNINVETLFDKD